MHCFLYLSTFWTTHYYTSSELKMMGKEDMTSLTIRSILSYFNNWAQPISHFWIKLILNTEYTDRPARPQAGIHTRYALWEDIRAWGGMCMHAFIWDECMCVHVSICDYTDYTVLGHLQCGFSNRLHLSGTCSPDVFFHPTQSCIRPLAGPDIIFPAQRK